MNKFLLTIAQSIEAIMEGLLFHSRWLLAPLYFGLVATLIMLTIKFLQEFVSIIPHVLEWHGAELVIAILELVDLVLISNLLVMIIFSGYENFVSKIRLASGHIDRPSWMGTIDYGHLKLKVIGSIVAISSIQLLKSFINVQGNSKIDIAWMIGIHMTFVFSGLLFAFTEKISHSRESSSVHGN